MIYKNEIRLQELQAIVLSGVLPDEMKSYKQGNPQSTISSAPPPVLERAHESLGSLPKPLEHLPGSNIANASGAATSSWNSSKRTILKAGVRLNFHSPTVLLYINFCTFYNVLVFV
jgi:hypothetical protein